MLVYLKFVWLWNIWPEYFLILRIIWTSASTELYFSTFKTTPIFLDLNREKPVIGYKYEIFVSNGWWNDQVEIQFLFTLDLWSCFICSLCLVFFYALAENIIKFVHYDHSLEVFPLYPSHPSIKAQFENFSRFLL